jgi:hypothetical protein
MAYSYRPKDPRAKLREVVVKYVQAMRVAGRVPNAGVVFGDDVVDATVAQMHGYLVEDRRSGRRYVLLEDGDVMCDPQEDWLDEPDDELVTLLAKSLADARMGGSGWLVSDHAVVSPRKVPDRRAALHLHLGTDRRG